MKTLILSVLIFSSFSLKAQCSDNNAHYLQFFDYDFLMLQEVDRISSEKLINPPCLSGTTLLQSQQDVDNFLINYPSCTELLGNLIIRDLPATPITNLDGLQNLTFINGYLDIWENPNLNDISGLINLTGVGSYMNIANNDNIISFANLTSLQSVGGTLNLGGNDKIINLLGLSNLSTIGGLNIGFSINLTSLNGLNLQNLNGDLVLENCSKLTNINALTSLSTITGDVRLSYISISNMNAFANLTSIDGNFHISSLNNLTSLNGLQNLTSIDGYIDISYNNNVTNISGISNISSNTIKSQVTYHDDIEIESNPKLSNCNINSICSVLADATKSVSVNSNSTNCSNIINLYAACSLNPFDVSLKAKERNTSGTIQIDQLVDMFATDEQINLNCENTTMFIDVWEKIQTPGLIDSGLVDVEFGVLNTTDQIVRQIFNDTLMELSSSNACMIVTGGDQTTLTLDQGKTYYIRYFDLESDGNQSGSLIFDTYYKDYYIVPPNTWDTPISSLELTVTEFTPTFIQMHNLGATDEGGNGPLASCGFGQETDVFAHFITGTPLNGASTVSHTIEIEKYNPEQYLTLQVIDESTLQEVYCGYIINSNIVYHLQISGLIPSNGYYIKLYDLDFDGIHTGIWDIAVFSPIALPISYTFLNLTKTINSVILTWSTATEINNQGFEVQHSTDARSWKNIGWVEENSTSAKPFEYEFIHDDTQSGNNYYRLKQIDFDGKYEYSEIRNVFFENTNNQEFYPNPVSNTLYFKKVVNYTISDLNGQVIRTGNASEVDISNLSSGLYFIDLGNKIERFIKF